MSVDLITLALAKKYSDSQRLAYTETNTVELLPPTECPLNQDSEPCYEIPNNALGGEHEYYLYVDGKEFKYDWDNGNPSWIETDETDRRFCAYMETIQPYEVDPVPDTVIASIKQISTIVHPIDKKYLPDGYAELPAKVNMLAIGGVVVPRTTYTFEVSSSDGQAMLDHSNVEGILFGGMRLNVHFDGVDYECVTTVFDDGNVAFGNLSYIGGEDSGEPFVFMYMPSEEMFGIVTLDTNDTHIVGVTIPGGGTGEVIPNVIDLDSYGIGQAVAEIVSAGGGHLVVSDTASFWTAINREGLLRLKQNYYEMTIWVDQSMRIMNGTQPVQLNYNFMAGTDIDSLQLFYVSIQYNGEDTYVAVRMG